MTTSSILHSKRQRRRQGQEGYPPSMRLTLTRRMRGGGGGRTTMVAAQKTSKLLFFSSLAAILVIAFLLLDGTTILFASAFSLTTTHPSFTSTTAPTTASARLLSMSRQQHPNQHEHGHETTDHPPSTPPSTYFSLEENGGNNLVSRRECLSFASAASLMLGSTFPTTAAAAEDSTDVATEVLSRLGNIPTFVIVEGNSDNENNDGVPFMIFNGEKSATGFFFLSYNMAQQALSDAKEKDKNSPSSAQIWNAASVRVIPFSVAMQLSLSMRTRTAVNPDKDIQKNTFNTYADLVMSEEGNLDAKRLDKERKNAVPGRWSNTKGRIPVFHVEGMTTKSGRQLWYFNIADLKADYKKMNDGQALQSNDAIELAEMMDLFRKASRKGDWSSLNKIRFMPVPESKQVAVQVVKKQPEDDPYNFEKVFLVSSSK